MNPISGRRVHESESFHDFSQTLVYPEPVYEKSDHLYCMERSAVTDLGKRLMEWIRKHRYPVAIIDPSTRSAGTSTCTTMRAIA